MGSSEKHKRQSRSVSRDDDRHRKGRKRSRHSRSPSRERSSRRSSRSPSRSDKKHRRSSHKDSRRSRDRSKSESRSRKERDRSRSRSRSRRDRKQRSRSKTRSKKDDKKEHKHERRSEEKGDNKEESKSKDVKRRSHSRSRRDKDGSRDRSRSRTRRRSTERENRSKDEKQKERKRERSKDEAKRENDEYESRSRKSSRRWDAPGNAEGQSRSSAEVDISPPSPSALVDIPKADIEAEQQRLDEEMAKRRERVKMWQEQRRKEKAEQEGSSGVVELSPTEVVESKGPSWSLEDEDDQEDKPGLGESIAEAPPIEGGTLSVATEAAVTKGEEEEVDPLDAFMMTLEGSTAQESIYSISEPLKGGGKGTNGVGRPVDQPKVITFEELMASKSDSGQANVNGTFLPSEGAGYDTDSEDREEYDPTKTNWGGETPGRFPEETDEEREEREHKEFMEAIRKQREAEERLQRGGEDGGPRNDKTGLGRLFQGEDEDLIGEGQGRADQRSALEILQEQQKKKELKPVDHSKANYISFRKKFYITPPEIKALSPEMVEEERKKLEIKIRGRGCPAPVHSWLQCGFSTRMMEVIKRMGYEEPFAIQKQALPCIMSGRDVIGVAKTGSGKTLAFLLPMFRQILAQPPLEEGGGPIGLVMAPARELTVQIYNEAKKFCKPLGLRVTAVYGGAGVKEQIADLKRGSDIVVCTPGRMIDILCMNAGKLISLQRVTYVVLDEADRMFDMGFEPQINMIIQNIRPDRQTVLFSATFPRQVENLAKKILTKPIEIVVGGRSVASGDIDQYVEVREEKDKFMRLLQLLGLWQDRGQILVFVNTQQACDQLFQDLMKAGYVCLSLHGGKDQIDRDYTISDFKKGLRPLMVATSVAGRGLDVADLVLVINYHCPNHLEDYVHRVGRTGRAGRKGTAYTFISPEEDQYAPILVKALEDGKQSVPAELKAMANQFVEKVKRGEARYASSGFRGKGFTFEDSEKSAEQKVADMQRRQYEIEQGIVNPFEDQATFSDDEDAEDTGAGPSAAPTDNLSKANIAAAAAAAAAAAEKASLANASDAVKRAHQLAAILNRQSTAKPTGDGNAEEEHFSEEIEINDYPQTARWKVTNKDTLAQITELTGVAIKLRGIHVPPGRKPNPGERKLHVLIEGHDKRAVADAVHEFHRILNEVTMQVGLGGERYSRYSVI